VEYKNKCDASNNEDNCNRIKIIQKITERHTGKARSEETTENSYTGHGTDTLESINNTVLPRDVIFAGI
jgi:hypothetical protein